jgi:integrating conjugative element protein (TIGR03757 family)
MSKRFLSRLRPLPLAACIAWSGLAAAQDVLVVTDTKQAISGEHKPTRVIELNAPQRIEAELTAGLPANPQKAALMVRQRFSEGGAALQQRMQRAYQGVTDAWSLGITTIPAVVVDGRYVLYGEPNIDHALARIAQYRKEHP